MAKQHLKPKQPVWKSNLYEIIFESDTPMGKFFDLALMVCIILSVFIVFIDSVSWMHIKYGKELYVLEWFFTILFTVEYILRIISSIKPSRYIFSFYGIIDLLAILPTYLSLILMGSQFLIVIRILRLLRIFRVLKLGRYVGASAVLALALRNSRHKIIVFLEVLMTLVVVVGSLMYLIEGPENGFTSIPQSIYWAIVTLTTVGYGDISPQTVLGQALASVVMIIGYAIIAVPTGIISVEMAKVGSGKETRCPECDASVKDEKANYCSNCGAMLGDD